MSDKTGRKYTFRYFSGKNMVSMNHIAADSDEQAIELAQDATYSFDVEVWDDGRFVFGTDGHSKGRTPPAMPA